MLPDEKNAALLWDMLVHAREVLGFVAGKTYEDYRENRLLRLAVERLVQIIGEAAYCVSRPYRDANPQIPWMPIMKQRHILVHDYGVIDDERIWRVATIHVAALIPLVESLLPPTPPDPFPEISGKP